MVNKRIGFNDTWVLLIGIPFSAFIIPIVFNGVRFTREPLYTPRIFFIALFYTVVIWVGNRYIMIWARKKYPLFDDVKRRIIRQSIVMFLFTIIACNLLGFAEFQIIEVWLQYPCTNTSPIDKLIEGNNAALFCSLTVSAIYESKYFMHELKSSVEEKELLKREALQSQLNALKTQINPHFLFNNLNTLSSIIPDNPQQAVDFVQQLSKVYRHILAVKDEEHILLENELEVLESYSFLLKTRFEDNINININVPSEYYSFQIPPLCLQLLMENAIKHNIISTDKPLYIEIYVVNNELVFKNNLQKKIQAVDSTGIGLNNIKNRMKLLTDKPVEIKQTDIYFAVTIPLLSI
ncbi:MAG: histidine kinase [Bacteroidota bacterium]